MNIVRNQTGIVFASHLRNRVFLRRRLASAIAKASTASKSVMMLAPMSSPIEPPMSPVTRNRNTLKVNNKHGNCLRVTIKCMNKNLLNVLIKTVHIISMDSTIFLERPIHSAKLPSVEKQQHSPLNKLAMRITQEASIYSCNVCFLALKCFLKNVAFYAKYSWEDKNGLFIIMNV